MKLTDIDIHDLIPQQEPFVMVGKLEACSEVETVTSTLVTADNLFVEDGYLLPAGIIENMAQTCAAGLGYANKYQSDKPVQIGFIGALRNLHIYSQPAAGQVITTAVRTVEKVFGMSLIEAKVLVDGELIAEGTLKIAIADSTSTANV